MTLLGVQGELPGDFGRGLAGEAEEPHRVMLELRRHRLLMLLLPLNLDYFLRGRTVPVPGCPDQRVNLRVKLAPGVAAGSAVTMYAAVGAVTV